MIYKSGFVWGCKEVIPSECKTWYQHSKIHLKQISQLFGRECKVKTHDDHPWCPLDLCAASYIKRPGSFTVFLSSVQNQSHMLEHPEERTKQGFEIRRCTSCKDRSHSGKTSARSRVSKNSSYPCPSQGLLPGLEGLTAGFLL